MSNIPESPLGHDKHEQQKKQNFHLVQQLLVLLVAGRMLIIGVINLFLITVILISMAYIYQKSMIEMVLYGLIPFNISCTCYLFICAKSRTNDSLYHLIACMIFLSGTFSLVLHQRFIFEAQFFQRHYQYLLYLQEFLNSYTGVLLS